MTQDSKPGRRRHIVLIEDNAGDVFLIKRALERNAIECDLTLFEDGEAALKALSMDADNPIQPDLILLDLNLPRRDGREVLRVAREQPSLAGTPIAVITSSFSARDREEALRLGATRYIHKPTNFAEFLDDVGGAIVALLG
ncbi:MAG: response regulator [Acidobacteria bacterium]|nr:response regulator [Acidobacteriota bacterium]